MKTSFLFRIAVLATVFNSVSTTIQAQTTVFTGASRSRAKSLVDEEYRVVGANKVKGNSYILKGANVSDIFTNIGVGANMPLVFDAYSGQVSILEADRVNVVDLASAELDSFVVKVDNDQKFNGPVKFINANRFDPSKKGYMLELASGKKYNLYKSYMVELRPAASDLAQTNIKEFEIMEEYYFMDMTTKTKFEKIKNEKAFKKAFKDKVPNFTAFDNAPGKFENKLIAFFDQVNK